MSSTEMKSYLSLIPISAKVRRRQNRMTILCIVIAVFLVSAIFSVADMMLRTQMNRAAGKDGSWHLQIAGITQSQAEQLAQQQDVVCAGVGAVFNEGGEEDYRLNGKRVVLYGCDAQFLRVNRSAAFEGTFPEQDGEVLLGKGAARIFGVAIGDSVTLKLPDGQSRTLTVTGIGGVDESYYEMQFALVDIYLPQETFESLLTGQGEALPQTVYDLQYTSAAKAAKALPQLQQQYGEDAVHENLNVMGSAGQSNSTAFRTVYGMAGVLFALVLLAGVLMISGTMNSNIAQRTRFFGMMRCLGMSKQQVVHFVRMEALNWCRIAIPIGLVLGTFSSWAVCGALRYGIGGEFATTPVFRLSMGGLCAGAVVGVVTVLLAAQAPAKQAAEVPPVAAASGSEQAAVVHHAANLGSGRTETALGIYHATASKKNWFLITASFALSIVLALGFIVILQFASLLLPSLAPWQADVIYTGYDNERVLPDTMAQQLRRMPGVARVWGCTGLVHVPASSDRNNVEQVTFCSYDDFMLESSKSMVVKGRMAKNSGADNEVMTMYNKTNPIRVGDTITVNGVPLTVVGAFSQGIFPDDVTIIAPETLFRRVAGEQNYNMIGVQLDRTASDETVLALAAFSSDQIVVQDLRESNRQDRGTYYAARIVLYGFLAIIGGISLLNIVNSISMSVSARMKQYGILRAIGMDDAQLKRMVSAEAGTYAVSGLVVGIALGLVLNRKLYILLITHYFGAAWQVPWGCLAVIVVVVLAAVVLAVYNPVRRILMQPITATISEL
ncbi:FtsX-like permease family protein [Faecalibacterium prausnitzii]|uniref:FtsX-like permease family protein n=1 Tax=Faecalibacterium prausnitzii TaxID=853 RepID=UPI00290EF913|nr:FtsX-like permease family protein [Faecalibacterium prausnitzii]MDU8670115.1 FtsX-like permease family protein [Faecalibacterium prausnitzii]